MNEDRPSGFPNLSKAPIILAILQLKFDTKENIEKHLSTRIKEQVKDKYPKFEQTKSAEVHVNPNDQKTPLSLKMLTSDGFSFIANDDRTRFTISKNTFTFQVGSPYSNWDDFFSQAWWAWKRCGLEENLNSVFWLSIRYINSFELLGNDNNVVEPSDYFRSYPTLPTQNQDFTRFLLQYSLPIEPQFIKVNVGIESRETMNNLFPFMFDIDVICTEKLPYIENDVKGVFNKLRDYKNKIFFDNLTDKTINLFK